jgi:hypothetical protein
VIPGSKSQKAPTEAPSARLLGGDSVRESAADVDEYAAV